MNGGGEGMQGRKALTKRPWEENPEYGCGKVGEDEKIHKYRREKIYVAK